MKLEPSQVRDKFGPLFSQRLLTMVDPAKNVAEIIETCAARGTIEWDAVNRCRAGGLIDWCAVEGTTMIMRARIGDQRANFGPADGEMGGQALEGITINGDTVTTKWAGTGGAGLGIAACLTQAPGVLYSVYPSESDLKVGGAHTNRVEIATPRYEKITIGVDDTDNKEGGATWVTALKAQKIAAALPGIQALDLRLIQLCPRSPNKTTNCVASAITFAVKPEAADALVRSVVGTVKADNRSDDPGIAVYRGIGIPPALNDFGWEIKQRLVTMEDVNRKAEENGVEFIDILGPQAGRIGALAAVALSEERTDAAALYQDKALPLIRS